MDLSQRLRARIERSLGWLPAAGLVACSETPPEAIRAGLGQPPPEHAEEDHEHAHGHDIVSEHEAEERERCPQGLWCGDPSAAELFGIPGDELVAGCPPRLHGNPTNGVDPMDPRFTGLSQNMEMRGELDAERSARGKAFGDDVSPQCCYEWIVHCVGRPLMDEGRQVTPEAELGPVRSERDASLLALGERWLAAAAEEHASVAAFARTVLELMALGAPPELIAGCQSAALDELRHARVSYALASEFLGRTCTPGPVPAVSPRVASFERLAIDTFVEGCIGETCAALRAAVELGNSEHRGVQAALRMIAEDEAEHAALAWRILAWILEEAPEIRESLRKLASTSPAGTAVDQQAWREVIAPTLDRLTS